MEWPVYPDLKGQVALVTGASQGIGAAIARALGRQGAVVGLMARSREKLEEVAAAIRAEGARGFPLVADVSQGEAVQAAIQEFIREVGPVTLLVNNAGITRDQLLLGLKPEDWHTVLAVDLTGAYWVTRAVLRDMLKVRRGSIVNISSVVALTGNPGQTAYAAAKAGLIGFTKSLARELASRGIRVNAIAPGYIETEMTARLGEALRAEYQKAIPLGFFGTPDDVAQATLFLLSSASRYITGTVLNVSGGLYM
ncbi:3-oxoacyl-[acyl-carrier-protein] reductase FabG [bacterium HR11]|nr:3-oxoacyl-[acyl-carrier-protein] reductase FabG [bacterium HR11]